MAGEMVRGLGNDPPFVASSDPMDEDEVAKVVQMAVREAINYCEELGDERAQATEYYQGKPFGNEEDGRSQVVLTEVRDAIIGVIPSVIRVIHGPEHTVEFVPRRADQVQLAEQATDYVRWVYEEDNDGLLITHSVLKDGLLKKLGIVKWGMEEGQERKTTKFKGLTREELALLASAPNASISNAMIHDGGIVDCEITLTEPVGRIWVMPIPPDDFFWNRDARSVQDAVLVGHRARLTRSELLKMGVSQEDLDEYGIPTNAVPTIEETARRPNNYSGVVNDVTLGPENQRILYCEVYMMLDVEGSGVAELRKICTLGDTFHPIKNDPVGCKPFAVFSPDPEPHAMLGGSWYDRLKDTQKINSQILRTILDSGAIAAFPRVAYVDGQASVADVMNTAIGAPIRMRAPGMVTPFVQEFTGEKLMPVLSYMQDVIERRVGQRDGAGSLDMDALQSTGQEAVNAAISAAQAQPELLARLFAEQLLKPLFRGLLELASLPTSKERILRLRGSYVPIQPQAFDPSMDVSVNVMLGAMNTEKKVAILRDVVADQSAIIGQYGPDNPVVSIAMLRNARAKILALQGIKDVESYYKPVDPNWQPPPPPPPQPSEDDKWRQAEAMMNQQKIEKELAIKTDELALKREQIAAELSLKERDIAAREREIELRMTEGPHNAELERYKAEMDALVAQQKIDAERERLAFEQDFEIRKIELEAALAANAKGADVVMQKELAREQRETELAKIKLTAEVTPKPVETAAENKTDKNEGKAETKAESVAPVVHVHMGGSKKTQIKKNGDGSYEAVTTTEDD